MTQPASHTITHLLVEWSNGNKSAAGELIPLVHGELLRLAHHYMSHERQGHTLQTTALVNEAYLRLVDQRSVRWQNRAHFYAIAAQLMRRILIDHARSHLSAKRGQGMLRVSLDQAADFSEDTADELIAIDEALDRLSTTDVRRARVVELRFFGGLSIDETAEVLQVSANTVMRDWGLAKAWLRREIGKT